MGVRSIAGGTVVPKGFHAPTYTGLEMAITDKEEVAANHVWLRVRGKSLEARRIAPQSETNPTLVFIHDGLGCVGLWDDFPAHFARATGCGALVYSRAGYGASETVKLPRAGLVLSDDALEVLPAVLDEADVHRAVLVGHGEGALIALLNVGIACDPRVKGLILMAPIIFSESIARSSAARTRAEFFSGMLHSRLLPHHGDNVDTAFWGWNRVCEEIASQASEFCDSLSNINSPSLLIQGARDPCGSAWQLQLLERQIVAPTSVVRLQQCGYAIYRERPDAVIEAGCRFLVGEGLVSPAAVGAMPPA